MADKTQVKRKIHFFRADPGVVDDGESKPHIKKFDPTPIIAELAALDELGKQLERTDGDLTFLRIFDGETNTKLQLTTVKMTEAPQRFNRGNSAFLSLDLAEEEGIAYTSHMILFPNNVLGVESNYLAPGVARLEEYFRKKADIEEAKVSFHPLINSDFEAKLKTMSEIRELTIRASSLDTEGAEEPLNDHQEEDGFRLMKEMSRVGKVGEYQLTWKAPHGSQESIPKHFIAVARRFVQRVSGQGEKSDNAAKVIVRGKQPDGHVEVIDVLNERLLFVEKAFKLNPGDRNVIPGSAFAAIETAYSKNKESIDRAAALYT